MVSDGHHIQISTQLNMLQNLFDSSAAIAIGAMHVCVCLTMLPRLVSLLCCHLAILLQHGRTCGCSFNSSDRSVWFDGSHVIPFLHLLACPAILSPARSSHSSYCMIDRQ